MNERKTMHGTGARGLATADHTQCRRSAPLQWWRADRCPRLDAVATAELRTALSQLHLLAHPTWPDAVAGDPSAVVRIAMTIRYDITSPTWLIDCAGSLALLSAAEGSETGAAVLRHLRRRYVVPARCRLQRSA
ncbi:MAG TPA: hypothetical protein VGV41_03085 [Pseudolabrys sp.]|jgi:hypothetical protein|uniref:hypothetical protein n=1 Tax=Pseudolabrys sp. TaxID=1960880 RepID=UPI002DDD1595|nr:hypothetical protein [Pseudolabrys sp.]HEV2627613.1 hypothetical protein [Pseudolabrys sp.]